MKKILLSSIILVVFFYVIFFFGAVFKQFGMLEDAGEISEMMLPNQVVVDKEKRIENIKQILAVESEKQILFGDLHVHTTFSTDAFMWSLPFFNGPGASPVSDACDFARFCSALDFWSINDHAEASTPRKWLETNQTSPLTRREVEGNEASQEEINKVKLEIKEFALNEVPSIK